MSSLPFIFFKNAFYLTNRTVTCPRILSVGGSDPQNAFQSVAFTLWASVQAGIKQCRDVGEVTVVPRTKLNQ